MRPDEVHEIFSYLVDRSVVQTEFLPDYQHYFDRLMPFMRLASLVSPFVKGVQNYKNRRFAFYTRRFNDVMDGLDNSSLLLFGKPQEFPSAVMGSVPFYPVYDMIPELMALFKSDPRLESVKAAGLIDRVTAMFARMSPEYLVVWNDSLFLERLLIFCGRRAGVKSICIQHGLFHESFDCRMLDGYYSDYMFVWGKSQADLYRDPGFNRDKLRVMGYPYTFSNHCKGTHDDVVCILGENFETLDSNVGLKKKFVYEELAALLTNKNYKVVYKPHPFEKDINFIPSNVEIVSIGLSRAFDNYDRFIALTSTALLEATLHGKIAIQYYDEYFGGCDFSLKGFSYTARSLDEIPLLLSSLTMPSVIGSEELVLSQKPGQLFLDAVNTL